VPYAEAMSARGSYSKGEAMRRTILEGALNVLADDGYNKTSIRGIARALKLAPAHILYYFPTREDLLQEVIVEWNQRRFRELPADMDYFETWIALNESHKRVPGIVQLYTAFAAEAADPAHPSHEFFRSRFANLRITIADQIRIRQSSGAFDPQRDPLDTATKLIALSDGLQLQWLMDRTVDMAAGLRDAINELATPPAPAPRSGDEVRAG
jgi:AcrR family transcriptional regulator